MFYFSVLDQEKIKNLMRQGGKKTIIFFLPIFEKVNEGAQIKKTFDKFLEKVMRATK